MGYKNSEKKGATRGRNEIGVWCCLEMTDVGKEGYKEKVFNT